MAYNFLACDRDQAFLLPPDLRDWLPSDHLAGQSMRERMKMTCRDGAFACEEEKPGAGFAR